MSGPTRRRFLALAGAALGLSGAMPRRDAGRLATTWRGFALGAPARLVLLDGDARRAAHACERIVAEVARLESILSLHRADSALARLNRDGVLDRPPLDLVVLFETAREVAAATNGAFDPTVQPIWRLLADHFARPGAALEGPPRRLIEAALARVGHEGVDVSTRRVALMRAGAAITLNGIAQGFIADRVAALLGEAGYVETLVDMGEIVAGPRAEGPWTIAGARRLRLAGAAVATSAPLGTVFDATGRFHHLIDPRTATCPRGCDTVTVVALNATLADALSTALAVTPGDAWAPILRAFPAVEVHVAWRDGTVETFGRRLSA